MLQQTQVSRVIPKYTAFLRSFPKLQSLAVAIQSEVIRAWSGLGYNRRAINLHRAAQAIMLEHKGIFPRTVEGLEQLPGIGPYTARAIAAFAYEQPVAMVDTNVRRVIGRYFVGVRPVPEKRMDSLAQSLVPKSDAWAWGHALMDFGAMVCTARDPKCGICPLRKTCQAAPMIAKLRARGERLQPLKKSKEVFHESNRYYRGRIVEALRARTSSASSLWWYLKNANPKAEKLKFTRALGELAKERFIVRSPKGYRLSP
jgi:A/G-specific adenine glycosylase